MPPGPDQIKLEDELRALRKQGVDEPRLAMRSQLLAVAQATVEDGDDQQKIEAVLRTAIDRLSVPSYVQAAACLFGLAPGTRKLSHSERCEIASGHYGCEPSTFKKKVQNKLCGDLTNKLLEISTESIENGPSVQLDRSPQTSRDHPNNSMQATDVDTAAACFDDCLEAKDRYDEELGAGGSEHPRTWWHRGSSAWLGSFFAFWFKTVTTPCEEIFYEYDWEDVYDPERFAVTAPEGDNPKAVVVSATPFNTDNPRKTLNCGVTSWDFCHKWAETHSGLLLKSSAQPSIFGVLDRTTYPGLMAVHALLYTKDGYILFALRSGPPHVDFLPETWSVSFEEQVSLTPREHTPHIPYDKTVLDTIEAGMHEEWGLPRSAIEISSCLAIGREYIKIATKTPPRLILNFGVITAVRLSIDLATVWRYLDDAPRIRDRDEHKAWAGCRFKKEQDVRTFLKAVRPSTRSENIWEHTKNSLGLDLVPYDKGEPPDVGDFGVTPGSAVRLLLGADWLASLPDP